MGTLNITQIGSSVMIGDGIGCTMRFFRGKYHLYSLLISVRFLFYFLLYYINIGINDIYHNMPNERNYWIETYSNVESYYS